MGKDDKFWGSQALWLIGPWVAYMLLVYVPLVLGMLWLVEGRESLPLFLGLVTVGLGMLMGSVVIPYWIMSKVDDWLLTRWARRRKEEKVQKELESRGLPKSTGAELVESAQSAGAEGSPASVAVPLVTRKD